MQIKLKELNQILESIDALYHKAAKKLGLSDAELTILYSLYEKGDGCPQKDFYNQTGISKSTVNSAVKKMEKDGIICLKATDGRSTALFLTEKGKTLSRNTVEKIVMIENSIYDSWSPEEREMAYRLNKKYMEQFAAAIKKL